MRIELIFVPSSRAAAVLCSVLCCNGYVYIYSRISGKKGKHYYVRCFRLDIILWVFLCAHTRTHIHSAERWSDKTERQVNSISCWIFYLYFHIKSHSFTSLTVCVTSWLNSCCTCHISMLFTLLWFYLARSNVFLLLAHSFTFYTRSESVVCALSCSHTRFNYSRVRVTVYLCACLCLCVCVARAICLFDLACI